MKYSVIALLLGVFVPPLSAQESKPLKFWVEFTDKKDSPFTIWEPAEFLSARALERRARAGIAVDSTDLPVNPHYIAALIQAGARLHNTSRWLNAATIIADSVTAERLVRLPFVARVLYVGPDIAVKNPPNRQPRERSAGASIPETVPIEFGYATRQNALLGVPVLHWTGARGRDIWVAVLDGGYTNADILPFFDSAAVEGRLWEGRDFVERDAAVYESAHHGTSVLSVMASNLPGYFIGTAPEATYFLLKTEDTGGEFPVEECNWIAGAEWADSIGVDLINASLGYTVFNDTTLGHFPWELDGKTAIGSRGARIAAKKGMIICNSAGNSGNEKPWNHIGVPSDAPGILAVGSCTYEGTRSEFSSLGPTADGRIKPDLVAPGDMVVTAGGNGFDLGLSSGTSLASPLLCGAIASLWSAFPDKTGKQILDAIYMASDQRLEPDNEMGYGLPDFTDAWLYLGGFYSDPSNNTWISTQYGDATWSFLPAVAWPDSTELFVEISDVFGNPIHQTRCAPGSGMVPLVQVDVPAQLQPGVYRIRFSAGNWQFTMAVGLARFPIRAERP